MANEVTPLRGTGEDHIGLQFIIVPTGKTYTTPDDKRGILVFREEFNTIEVNGHLYHCDDINTTHANDFTNLATALTALKEAGLMTESNGIYTKSTPITVSETGISLGTGVTTGTIQQFLTALEGEIGALRTDQTTDVKTVNNIGVAQDTHNVTITGHNITVGGEGAHTASKIDAAIEDLYSNISSTGTSRQLHLYTGTEGTTTPQDGTIHADGNTYRLVQGTTEVARFSIEKDSFVKEGTLVYGPADDGQGGPGLAPNGTSPDANEVASPDTASGKTTPYLKLVIKSDTAGEYYVYIKASDLVDVYTVPTTQAGPVTLSINNHTISAAFDIDENTASANATATAPDPVSGATKSTYVNVVKGVSVTTENGEVKDDGVEVTDQAVDAAGAANAAYNDALGTSSDASTATTIYGARALAAAALAEAAKHTSVSGSGTTAASTHDYINVTASENPNAAGGVEYVVKTNTNLDAAIESAETNAKNYADTIITWRIVDETAP